MIKVKLSYPYSEINIETQMPKIGFSDIKFFINPKEDETHYDYWIVFNFLNEKTERTICPKENTIFLAMEPYSIKTFYKEFLNQFETIVSCQKKILNQFPKKTIYRSPPYLWFFKKPYDDLINIKDIKKTKLLSIISSTKTFTKGHRERLNFAYAVKEHFKENVDLFGRGLNPFDDKWDTLAPYKYSIAIENCFSENYFTEKLFDCFLSHTFPIYYGCPNIEDYYSKNSLEKIDINNLDKSIKIIEYLLNDENHYKNHFSEIIEAKRKTLEEYSFFQFCRNIILEKEKNTKEKKYENIVLRQDDFPNTPSLLLQKLENRMYRKWQSIF